MYCSHCAPCPQKIDVASVTKILNLAKAQGTLPETVPEHYAVLPHHAGDMLRAAPVRRDVPWREDCGEYERSGEGVWEVT